MQYKDVDSIVTKIIRDYGVQTSYINSIREWIYEGFGVMQCTKMYIPFIKKFKIKNNMVCLPPSVYTVIGVWYKENRVRPINFVGKFEDYDLSQAPYSTIWQSNMPPSFEGTLEEVAESNYSSYLQSISLLQSRVVDTRELDAKVMNYKQVENRLTFSVNHVEVEIAYYDLPESADGHKMIPFTDKLNEALSSFIRFKLIRRGAIKENWQPEYALFEKLAGKAIAEITMPTPEEVQMMADTEIGLIKLDPYESNLI